MIVQDVNPEQTMEPWRKVWREGLSPLLSPRALLALKTALETDDPALIQRQTTQPSEIEASAETLCEGACLIGFTGWKGEGLLHVDDVAEYFSRMCCAVGVLLGDPGGVHYLIHWWDITPRDEARLALLAEVERSLQIKEPVS
jgi:hypothetical protein